MKLIFAVLVVSLTMGLTRCYKTEGFFTFIFVTWPFFESQLKVATGHVHFKIIINTDVTLCMFSAEKKQLKNN